MTQWVCFNTPGFFQPCFFPLFASFSGARNARKKNTLLYHFLSCLFQRHMIYLNSDPSMLNQFLLLQLLLIYPFPMQGLALHGYRLHLLMQTSKWYHLLYPFSRHRYPGSPMILFPAHRHLMTKTR